MSSGGQGASGAGSRRTAGLPRAPGGTTPIADVTWKFHAGEFGMPSDCVAQCEAIYALEKGEIDIASGVIGRLDTARLRDVIRAIGDVIDSDCEPN